MPLYEQLEVDDEVIDDLAYDGFTDLPDTNRHNLTLEEMENRRTNEILLGWIAEWYGIDRDTAIKSTKPIDIRKRPDYAEGMDMLLRMEVEALLENRPPPPEVRDANLLFDKDEVVFTDELEDIKRTYDQMGRKVVEQDDGDFIFQEPVLISEPIDAFTEPEEIYKKVLPPHRDPTEVVLGHEALDMRYILNSGAPAIRYNPDPLSHLFDRRTGVFGRPAGPMDRKKFLTQPPIVQMYPPEFVLATSDNPDSASGETSSVSANADADANGYVVVNDDEVSGDRISPFARPGVPNLSPPMTDEQVTDIIKPMWVVDGGVDWNDTVKVWFAGNEMFDPPKVSETPWVKTKLDKMAVEEADQAIKELKEMGDAIYEDKARTLKLLMKSDLIAKKRHTLDPEGGLSNLYSDSIIPTPKMSRILSGEDVIKSNNTAEISEVEEVDIDKAMEDPDAPEMAKFVERFTFGNSYKEYDDMPFGEDPDVELIELEPEDKSKKRRYLKTDEPMFEWEYPIIPSQISVTGKLITMDEIGEFYEKLVPEHELMLGHIDKEKKSEEESERETTSAEQTKQLAEKDAEQLAEIETEKSTEIETVTESDTKQQESLDADISEIPGEREAVYSGPTELAVSNVSINSFAGSFETNQERQDHVGLRIAHDEEVVTASNSNWEDSKIFKTTEAEASRIITEREGPGSTFTMFAFHEHVREEVIPTLLTASWSGDVEKLTEICAEGVCS